MKSALKHKRIYIIAAILSILGVGLPFGILAITLIPSLNLQTFAYPYLLWIFAAGYFLIGFVWGDLRVANWRRKNKEWDGQVDPKIKESAWVARWSFWFPSFFTLAVTLVFEIIAIISGGYPFLGAI